MKIPRPARRAIRAYFAAMTCSWNLYSVYGYELAGLERELDRVYLNRGKQAFQVAARILGAGVAHAIIEAHSKCFAKEYFKNRLGDGPWQHRFDRLKQKREELTALIREAKVPPEEAYRDLNVLVTNYTSEIDNFTNTLQKKGARQLQ